MESIAEALYSATQMRELDRRAIAVSGIPGHVLMQRAAAAAWGALREHWPQARRIVLFCGSGNNGGDGYEIARLARAAGFSVQLFELDASPRGGDAAIARAAWLTQGSVEPWNHGDRLPESDVLVDAIFGIGLSRAPEGTARSAIEAINAAAVCGTAVLAIDIPSGLLADTGAVMGAAVDADLTVTFIGRKLGLHTGEGPAHAGQVLLDTLAVPASVYVGIEPIARLMQAADLRRCLPPRRRTAHKGDNGHVLLIGGDRGMAGAILIAARAALRAGAGLVTVATRAEHAAMLAAAQPEVMFRGAESEAEMRALLTRADVVAIGPGLGQQEWGRSALAIVLESALPKIVDADALNLLARDHRGSAHWILTPHPGEAARLLGTSPAGVQSHRVEAVAALRERYGGVAVLKGAGTLVRGERLHVCPYGNPGMGVGGMGDALTGIIAAFVAQGSSLEDAATAGVTAHALAGDRAAQSGERGLTPTDLIDALRRVVNP